MSIIEGVRNYILSCPYLNKGRVNIDWLGATPTEYSIESTPTQPIVKRYADGGTIRQFNFVFSSVEFYGPDVLSNIENSGFYQKFSAWIEEQNKKRNLPYIGVGLIPHSIEVTTTGYLYESSSDQGRYQIQLKLLYYKD